MNLLGRGVGSSKSALSCLPYYFAGVRPNYIPSNQYLGNIWLQRSKAYAMACANNNSKLLQHMTTIDTANDMESIRIALGQNQINYYGFSYDTYLGQVYSTLFPDRVRRMVLDSNVDPRAVWFQCNLNQDIDFDRNINLWFSWLAKYDSVYHLGNTQSQVAQRWFDVLNNLKTNPANGTVGPDEWVDVSYLVGYVQELWISLAETFAQWANNKNSSLLLEYYDAYDNPGDDNEYAVYLAVECTDTQWPQSS
jgi:pimeloyl-ACP methyl ester carboxylesterase